MPILNPHTGLPATSSAPLTEDQRVALMAAEIRTLEAAGDWPAFAVPPLSLLMIVGALQLAKRHQDFPDNHRAEVDRLIQSARDFYEQAEAHTLVEVIDQGDNPAFDGGTLVPRVPQP